MRMTLLISIFLLLAVFTATGGLAQAAWGDLFPAPEAIGPGSPNSPGPVLNSLTPEFKFILAGSISRIYLFDASEPRVTLGELSAGRSTPLLMVSVNSPSLQIPAGILLPGKSYYWYIESIHAPGSKSEATRTSERMHFLTAKDAK